MAVWKPLSVPINVRDPVLSRYLRDMLFGLADYLNFGGKEFVWFEKVNLTSDVPQKPQEGMMIYVEAGVLPGNQKGYHYYDGTQWVKL